MTTLLKSRLKKQVVANVNALLSAYLNLEEKDSALIKNKKEKTKQTKKNQDIDLYSASYTKN
jgi:hypothetical protein